MHKASRLLLLCSLGVVVFCDSPHLLLVFQGPQAERQAGEPVVDLVENIPNRWKNNEQKQSAPKPWISRATQQIETSKALVCVAEGVETARTCEAKRRSRLQHCQPHRRLEKRIQDMLTARIQTLPNLSRKNDYNST